MKNSGRKNPIRKIIDQASEILAKTDVDTDFEPIYINTEHTDGDHYITHLSLLLKRFNGATMLNLNAYHIPFPYRNSVLLKYGTGKELADYLADKHAVEAEIRKLIPRMADGLKEAVNESRCY